MKENNNNKKIGLILENQPKIQVSRPLSLSLSAARHYRVAQPPFLTPLPCPTKPVLEDPDATSYQR